MVKSKLEAWWQGGVKLSIQLTGWLVGPLFAAYLVGTRLDTYYDTKPWIFLGLTFVAFACTCIGITIETMKFVRSYDTTETGRNNRDTKKPHDNSTNNSSNRSV